MRLNLGCGNTKIEGCINIDKRKNVNPDLVMDFEKDIFPYEDNSVEGIFAIHVIEHIKNIHHLMKEIYRVCMNDAEILFVSPYYKHISAFSDPDHIRFITEESFGYFCQDTKTSDSQKPKDHYAYDVNFQLVGVKYSWDMYRNERKDIYTTLRVKK